MSVSSTLAQAAQNKAAQCTLISPGAAAPVIVIGEKASPSERFAADEMAGYLKKITGTRVEIASDTVKASARVTIAIGRSRLTARENISKLGCEQYLIDVKPNRVTIIGGVRKAKMGQGPRDAGTLYGVYQFLDELGVRWYRPEAWGEHVPQNDTISLRTSRRFSAPPAFMFRAIQHWGRSPYREATEEELREDSIWLARNRMNALTHTFFGPTSKDNFFPLGGAEKDAALVAKLGGQEHYEYDHMYRYILPPDEYFPKHPEYFALIKGKRDKSDLCLGSPEMQRVFANNLIAKAKAQPELTGLSIEPSDALGSSCECPLCKAMDLPLNNQLDGAGSNRVAKFGDIISALVAKEAPWAKIVWLAYSGHTAAPTNVKRLEPNSVVMIAPINQWSDWTKDLMDASSTNADLVKTIQGWVALKPHSVMAWEYYDGYGWPGPLPYTYSVADRWRNYRKLGMNGIFNHSFTSWGPQSLDRYMSMRLAWNPDTDIEKELNLYYKNYYGPAAAPMKRYHEALFDAFRNAKELVQSGGRGVHLIFTPMLMDELGRNMTEAQSLVKGKSLYERRLYGVWAGYEFARRVSEILSLKKKYGVPVSSHTAVSGQANVPPDLVRPIFPGAGSYLQSSEAEKAYGELIIWMKSVNTGDMVFDFIRKRPLTEDVSKTIFPKGNIGDIGSIWLCYLPNDILLNYAHAEKKEEDLLKEF